MQLQETDENAINQKRWHRELRSGTVICNVSHTVIFKFRSFIHSRLHIDSMCRSEVFNSSDLDVLLSTRLKLFYMEGCMETALHLLLLHCLEI